MNSPTTVNIPSLVDIIDNASKEVLAAAEAGRPMDTNAARICALVAAMTAKEVKTAQAQAILATIPSQTH